MSDPILQTIAPVTHDLGGFKVHRTLPSRERTMVGPERFLHACQCTSMHNLGFVALSLIIQWHTLVTDAPQAIRVIWAK